MSLGTSCHKAAEVDVDHRVFFQERPSLDTLMDAYSDEYDSQAPEVHVDDKSMEEAGSDDPATVIGRMKDIGYESVKVYADQVSPIINPTAAEVKFELKLTGDYDIHGVIDVLEDDMVTTKLGDLKFTGSASRKFDVENDIQTTIYAAAYQSMTGSLPDVVYQRVLRRMKREIRVETYETVKTEEDVNRGLLIADSVADSIEKEVFLPTGLDTWKCSPRYCEFYPCKYVKGT